MQITYSQADDETLVLKLVGRLDFTHRQDFINVVERLSREMPGRAVHVDCSGLLDIDSSGLGMLLVLRDRVHHIGTSLALVGCGRRVSEVLNTVQFGRLFQLL